MAGTSGLGSPVTNVQYDMIAMGSNLLQGIAALEQYQRDAADDGNTEAEDLFENVRGKLLEAWDYVKAYDDVTCNRPGARGPHLSGCRH